jgi:hypothetical protein
MFAMGNTAQAIPSHGLCLSLKLFVAPRAVFRREVGDILNSLQGKRSRISSSSAEAADSSWLNSTQKLSMIEPQQALYGLRTFVKGAEGKKDLQEDLVAAGLLRVCRR